MKIVSTSSLTWIAIGVAAVAMAVLFAFSAEPLVWQVAAWALVAALAALLPLVLASGYLLATDRAARTWQRTVAFLVGLGLLATLAIGSF